MVTVSLCEKIPRPDELVIRNSNVIRITTEISTMTPTFSCDHRTSCWLGISLLDRFQSRARRLSGNVRTPQAHTLDVRVPSPHRTRLAYRVVMNQWMRKQDGGFKCAKLHPLTAQSNRLSLQQHDRHCQLPAMSQAHRESRRRPAAHANSAARPLSCSPGLPLRSRVTSISSQLTPRLMPVPSALAAASFAANRAAKLSAGFFFRRQ